MLKVAKIVGVNSDIEASLALVSNNQALLRFFAIVSCEAEDAFSRTRQALVEAEDTFDTFEGTLANKLAEVASSIKHSLSDTQNLQFLLAAVQEDSAGEALYLLCQAEHLNAYLLRGDKKSRLCESTASSEIVSGILKPGDRVVLTTQSLIDLLGDSWEIFQNLQVGEIEDEIVSRLPQMQSFPAAAIVIAKDPESLVTEEIQTLNPPETPTQRVSLPKISLLPYLKRLVPRSKRGGAILGVLLLSIILASTAFSYLNKKNQSSEQAFNQQIKLASESYSKAEAAKDSDPGEAAKNLAEAKTALAAAFKINPNNSQAKELETKINNNSKSILKTFQVDDFPLWLDLDLIKKGLSPKNLSLSHGKLLVLDTDKKVLAQINLSNKSQQILGGGDKIGEAQLASLNGNVAWIYSKDKGILKIEDNNDPKVVVKSDKEWGSILDIYGFGGNLYVLDGGKNQIWKYLPLASGYSDKRAYFKEGVVVDLSSAKRLQIDSSVWILKNNGDISKFTQGATDFFSVGGLDKGIKDPKSLFVSDETDNFYLLDSGNNRILVLDKKGVYKTQYQSEKMNEFTDLVVDESNKKIYLLSGSKIFQMELK